MGDLLLRSYYTHKIIMQIVFCLVILTFYHYHSNNSVKKPIFIIDLSHVLPGEPLSMMGLL